MRSKQRKREAWLEIIEAFERSGQSQTAFAKAQGLSLGSLNSWITKERRRPPAEVGALLPVRVIGSPQASRQEMLGGAVEVMMLRFGDGTAAAFVSEVIGRMRAGC